MILELPDLVDLMRLSQNPLDLAAGSVSLLNASLLSAIHSLTSPKAGHWMPAPWWLRLAMLPVIVLCAGRGAEFLTATEGHATLLAVATGLAFTVLFSAFLAFVLSMTYPVAIWNRLRSISNILSCKRREREALIPVMVSAAAVSGVEAQNPRSHAIPPGAVPAEWVPPEVVH